jgi:hypothetical protein
MTHSSVSPFYKRHQLTELREGYDSVTPAYERLMANYLSLRLANEGAYEDVRHGFVRRLGTLKRCIENVYSTYSPERSDKPSRNECLDLAINLQSFISNVFGCIDNLAWIWVKEKKVTDKQDRPLRGQQVGLRPRQEVVRQSFSIKFQQYLISRDDWFGHLEDFRHALAHRIPLYVIPYILHPDKLQAHNDLEERKREAHNKRDFRAYEQLDAEQENLGTFSPYMTHSMTERAPLVPFHCQILADWNTVVEMADEFLQELPRSR